MSYAKIDDLYDDKPKVKRAWRAHPPNPVGVHAMAITHCVRHRLDGRVPDEWIEDVLRKPRERVAILHTLVKERLFEDDPHDLGRYRVHDFLDWNESAAERETRSEAAKQAADSRWGTNAKRNAARNANRNATGNAAGRAPVA